MREYKVLSQARSCGSVWNVPMTYFGFNFDFSKPHRLVLVQDEDTILAVALDEDRETNNGCNDVLQNSISQLCKFITDHSPWMKIISTYNDSKFQGFKISDEYLNGCTLDDEADRRN